MKTLLHVPSVRRARLPAVFVALVATGALVAGTGPAQAVASPAPLGTAGSFAVLAGSGITNTGPTTVWGDLGTFPTTTVTGAGSITVLGTNHGGDAVTQQAKQDLRVAYDAAAGQASDGAIAGELGGRRLTTGVYSSASTIRLTGELVLDGAGDADAVFVFQAGSSLTTATASSVRLVGGAQACNVYWQVGESATLGTGSTFRGTLMALTSITVTTGVTIEGRVLARNGAVTLDTDTITRPACTAAVSQTPTASPVTPSPAATPGSSVSGGTSRQVTRVPSGGVSTGDGSAAIPGSAGVGSGASIAAAVLAGVAALTAGAIGARRRHPRS